MFNKKKRSRKFFENISISLVLAEIIQFLKQIKKNIFCLMTVLLTLTSLKCQQPILHILTAVF